MTGATNWLAEVSPVGRMCAESVVPAQHTTNKMSVSISPLRIVRGGSARAVP